MTFDEWWKENTWWEEPGEKEAAQDLWKVAQEAMQERATAECMEDSDTYESAGNSHPEDSEQRDRCYARARAVTRAADKIRALKVE